MLTFWTVYGLVTLLAVAAWRLFIIRQRIEVSTLFGIVLYWPLLTSVLIFVTMKDWLESVWDFKI